MKANKEKRVSRVREMKNDLILDAALEVFSEKGFHDSRLEDIAQQAGFSKASLYNYYKDKEMIFVNLATREYQILQEKMLNDPLLKVDHTLPFSENIRRILTLVFETFGKHFAFLLSMNSFQFYTIFNSVKQKKREENLEEQLEDARCEMHNTFMILVEKAIENGDINTSLTPLQIHTLFDAIIDGTVREWHSNGEMGDIESTVEQLSLFFISGLNSR